MFAQVVKEVKSFYDEYNKTIVEIDKCFNEIDENEGKDSDNNLAAIFSSLLNFWNSKKKKGNIDGIVGQRASDPVVDEFEGQIRKLLTDYNNQDFFNLLQETQKYFSDYSALDSIPLVFSTSNELIDSIFTILDQNEKDFSCIRLLYEIVSDDLIIRCGISRLSSWKYGSDAYSLLSSEEQLTLLLDLCILFDRLHNGHYLLEKYIPYLNTLINSFISLDWFVYYAVGLLNFKIHNYSESEKLFINVEKFKQLRTSDDSQTNLRYFHSLLLIAYGYEYKEKYDIAILKLCTSVKCIEEILSHYSVHDITSDTELIMNSIYENRVEDSLIDLYFKKIEDSDDIFQQAFCYDDSIKSKRVEILHALAHCLNEYAINSQKKDSFKMICLARAIMLYLANNDNGYLTCYATIHGEYKDYSIAVDELEKARNTIRKNNNGIIKETLSAEIDFFDYYFRSMLQRESLIPQLNFENYCKKYSDDDALCHVRIYNFRTKFRCYLDEFIKCLRQNKVIYSDTLPSLESLEANYKELCKLHPSLYINANVRAELRSLQRAYIVIYNLKNYLIENTDKNKALVINACKRFLCVRKELGLSENTENTEENDEKTDEIHWEDDDFSSLLNLSLKRIINCIYSSDTAFILAPISGVIVYQYQTGKIDCLFDPNDVIPKKRNRSSTDLSDGFIPTLRRTYYDTTNLYNMQCISDLNWDELKKYGVDTVYLWDKKIKYKILVATPRRNYERRLLDHVAFKETLDKIFSDNFIEYCENENRITEGGELCQVRQIHQNNMNWAEVINESNGKFFFFFEKKGYNGSRYIILRMTEKVEAKCDLHGIIEAARYILSKNQPDDINVDELEIDIKELYYHYHRIKEELDGKKRSMDNFDDQTVKSSLSSQIESLNNELSQIKDLSIQKQKDLKKRDLEKYRLLSGYFLSPIYEYDLVSLQSGIIILYNAYIKTNDEISKKREDRKNNSDSKSKDLLNSQIATLEEKLDRISSLSLKMQELLKEKYPEEYEILKPRITNLILA